MRKITEFRDTNPTANALSDPAQNRHRECSMNSHPVQHHTKRSQFLTLAAGFCFFEKTTCARVGLTELSTPLGILPSRTAPLRRFRTPYFSDSIFIKEPVSADCCPILDAASRLQGRQPAQTITSRRKAICVSFGTRARRTAPGARWPPRRPRAGSRTYFRPLHSQWSPGQVTRIKNKT